MKKLYCAICGYNLQGLAENRCPECGVAFDPGDLTPLPKPITLGELLGQLLILPAILWGSVLSAMILGPFGAIPVTISVACQLIGGIMVSRKLAQRLAVARSDGSTSGLERRGFITLCTIGLYCCQIFLSFGGCVACVALTI
jgi:hypothetical protein